MRYTLMFEANRTNLKQMKEKKNLFRGVCKPCNDSNVLGTPLIKGQLRNVWRGINITKTALLFIIIFCTTFPYRINLILLILMVIKYVTHSLVVFAETLITLPSL